MSDIDKPTYDELVEVLMDAVAQGCYSSSDGQLDSCALSSYADVLEVLARLGKVEIIRAQGKRVIARWAQPEEGP